MCRVWIAYITAGLRTLWGIPAEQWTDLGTLFTAAEGWLEKAQDMAERTHVISVACNEAFAALGFREKDDHHTPAGELGFRIVYVSGDPRDRANAGYRVWYSVVAPREAPPAKPEYLRKSFFTRRKRDFITFDYGDAGKTAYIAVQIENGSGKQGKFGPMVSAIIP
jgi:hypothetical protein